MVQLLYCCDDIFPHETGIYAIYFKNSKNNKVYIGSAAYISKYVVGFNKRWKSHLLNLKNGQHHSKKLQNAYNFYGESNLIFEIIEKCSPEKCIEIEQLYMNLFNSYKFGYNSRPTAENQLGYKWSTESRRKISLSKTEWRKKIKERVKELYDSGLPSRKIAAELKIHYKTVLRILKQNFHINKFRIRADYVRVKIYQYDSLGIFVKEWNSIYEASNNLGISESCILHVLKNESAIRGGFHFSYSQLTPEEVVNKIIITNDRFLKNRSLASKKSWSNPDRKFTIQEFSVDRREGVRRRAIGNNYRKKIENIKQMDLSGNLIKIWNNSKDIVIFYGLKNATPILRVLKGERKTFRGYKWGK